MRVRRGRAGEFVVQVERDVPNGAEPWARGALAAAVGLMPDGFAARRVPMMPDMTGTGIYQPWRELQGSALLVSSPAAEEISVQRGLAAEPLLDPRQLPVQPVGAVLRGAAEYVLACTQPETLLRVAIHWAFACEVFHRPWAQNRDTLGFHALSGPEVNLQQMKAGAHRLVIPQLVRVIAMDAVYSRDGTGGETGDPSQLSTLARTLVAEFFASIDRSEPPSHPEIRTALWILSQDTPFADLGDGGSSTLMAYTFGLQSIGEPDDSLRRWRELVSLPDNHPHGSWVEGEAPSDLRSDLRTTSGLDLRDVAAAVRWMLTRMVRLQYLSNQLLTMPGLVSLADSTRGSPAEDALSFVSDQLVTGIDQLRNAGRFGQASSNTGDLGGTAVERRKSIEERCHERPFVQFDDGTIAPMSIPDTVYRTIELCQEAHNNQNESVQQRRQRIGNILGRCFEAHVKSLCHSLGTHHVIDSNIINKVIDREAGSGSKRADLVIGDGTGNYVVLEITKRNLLGGIRYGDPASLDRWVDEHLAKLQQITSTVPHLPAITADSGTPAPLKTARLVVADLPLRQDIGLSALFDVRSDDRHPPFLCGISEFEILIERGRQGHSVPSIIYAWQNNNSNDASLGLFLSNHPAH